MRARQMHRIAAVATPLLAAAALAACSNLLGFEDPSLAPPGTEGDASAADGSFTDSASVDGSANVDGGANDAAIATDSGDGAADCGALLGNAENCGACGHSCLGGACLANKCTPSVLAGGLSAPLGIAVDAKTIYVAVFDRIVTIDKTNGAVGDLLPGAAGDPRGIFVDDAGVFWVGANTAVSSCSPTGCDAGPMQFVDPADPSSIPAAAVVSGERVYWSEAFGQTLRSADKRDGGDVRVLSTSDIALALAADGTYVYAADRDPNTIVRFRIDDAGVTPLGSVADYPSDILVTNGQVFVGVQHGALSSLRTDGGAPIAFGAPTKSAGKLATDGEYLYWADLGGFDAGAFVTGDGCIRRCALATCTTAAPEVVACNQTGAYAVAVDNVAVYWTNRGANFGEGTVMRVAKPPR